MVKNKLVLFLMTFTTISLFSAQIGQLEQSENIVSKIKSKLISVRKTIIRNPKKTFAVAILISSAATLALSLKLQNFLQTILQSAVELLKEKLKFGSGSDPVKNINIDYQHQINILQDLNAGLNVKIIALSSEIDSLKTILSASNNKIDELFGLLEFLTIRTSNLETNVDEIKAHRANRSVHFRLNDYRDNVVANGINQVIPYG